MMGELHTGDVLHESVRLGVLSVADSPVINFGTWNDDGTRTELLNIFGYRLRLHGAYFLFSGFARPTEDGEICEPVPGELFEYRKVLFHQAGGDADDGERPGGTTGMIGHIRLEKKIYENIELMLNTETPPHVVMSTKISEGNFESFADLLRPEYFFSAQAVQMTGFAPMPGAKRDGCGEPEDKSPFQFVRIDFFPRMKKEEEAPPGTISVPGTGRPLMKQERVLLSKMERKTAGARKPAPIPYGTGAGVPVKEP